MDNIIDTFNINKMIIDEESILKEETKISTEIDENDIMIKKKRLIDMASNLNNIEYHEILNIIQKDNCNYSSNTNGVFINLTNVENNTINKIYNFLKFTKQKKEELKEKESYLENFKKDIETESVIPVNSQIVNNTKIIQDDEKSIETLSDNNDNTNYNDYLCFSSDDEDNKNIKK